MTTLSNYLDPMVYVKAKLEVYINNAWVDYSHNLDGFSILSQGSEYTYGYRETEADIDLVEVENSELFLINTPIRLTIYNMSSASETPTSQYVYNLFTQKRSTETDRAAKIKCKGELDRVLENKPNYDFGGAFGIRLEYSVKSWAEKLLSYTGLPYSVPTYDKVVSYPVNNIVPISRQIQHFLGAYFGNLYIDNDGVIKLVSVADVLNGLITPVATITHDNIYMESGFRSVSVADRFYFNKIRVRGYNLEKRWFQPLFDSSPMVQVPPNGETITYQFNVDSGWISAAQDIYLQFVTDPQNPDTSEISTNIVWTVEAQAPETKVNLLFTITNKNAVAVYLKGVLFNGPGLRYSSRLEKTKENTDLVALEGEKVEVVESIIIQDVLMADSVARMANYASSGYIDITVPYNPQLLFGAYIRVMDINNVEKGGIILRADHKFAPKSGDMSVRLLVRLLPDTVQSDVGFFAFEDPNNGFENSGFAPQS